MPSSEDDARYARFVGFGLLVLLLVRLAVAARMPLAFDEAYYWLWSEHLAAGYYDHPPMVALVIRLGTMIAGDTELGVRLVSVLLAVPATWAVWRAAAILFGDSRLAATAALFFNLTLMVGAGTVVVTPDAPLLTASAFVLFFLAKVTETADGRWWLAVGLAAGCALLSKYNALFFGVGILAWLIVVPTMRRWLATPWPYLGGALALALFAPVILWNVEHQWVSFQKQFGRAVVQQWTLRYLGEYVAAQIGLATPSIFVLGTMGVWALLRGRGAGQAARALLIALILPAAIYFVWHSLHARVEGNWTAPVFPAFALAAAAAAHAVGWKGGSARLAAWSHRLAAPVALAMIGDHLRPGHIRRHSARRRRSDRAPTGDRLACGRDGDRCIPQSVRCPRRTHHRLRSHRLAFVLSAVRASRGAAQRAHPLGQCARAQPGPIQGPAALCLRGCVWRCGTGARPFRFGAGSRAHTASAPRRGDRGLHNLSRAEVRAEIRSIARFLEVPVATERPVQPSGSFASARLH